MGRTVTLDEIKDRTVSEIVQEAVQSHQPLIVTLDDGTAVTIQQYNPPSDTLQEPPKLKPILTLPGYIPEGWQDAIYDEQH